MTFRYGGPLARVAGGCLAAAGLVMGWGGTVLLRGQGIVVGAIVLFFGAAVVAAGLYLVFRISTVAFDLAAGRWGRRTGLFFRPKVESGSFNELKDVLVERFIFGEKSGAERVRYEVDVRGKKKRLELFVGTEATETAAVELAARVAGKLGLPVVKKLEEDGAG